MPFCEICGKHYFNSLHHTCPPIYEVNHPEYVGNDEWVGYHAEDEEDAAEQYGKSYNEDGEYSLMHSEIEIRVRLKGSDKLKKFKVSAEPDVSYYVEEAR